MKKYNLNDACPECSKGSLALDGEELRCDGCGKKFPKAPKATRMDVADLQWEQNTTPMQDTPEGYLTGIACLTNVGVFTYTQKDGTKRRELRLPEEVFKEESLRTLKLKPMTRNHHPEVNSGLVNAENYKALTVGSVGEEIYHDPYRVYGRITVQDKEAVAAARTSESYLSAGYTCDMDYTAGVWMGQEYDAIQRNIIYNHMALVPKGRAGDDVALRFDCAEGVCAPKDLNTNPSPTGHDTQESHMKTVRLDGVEYQAEAPVVAALHQAGEKILALEEKARLDGEDLGKAQSQMQGVMDENKSLKAQLSEAQTALKTRMDAAPADLEAAVQSRLALHTACSKAGVEFRMDASESELKAAVIQSAFPGVSLEGKDASYINARFDSAMDIIAAREEHGTRMDSADVPAKGQANSGVRMDAAEQAYLKNVERMRNGLRDTQA